MTPQEKKARTLISTLEMGQLLDAWELTAQVNDVYIPTVRGWLMDEFEKRNQAAFNAWLESEEEDATLRWYMMSVEAVR